MLHLLFTVSRHITVLLHTNKQLLFLKNVPPLTLGLNPTILLLHTSDIRHIVYLFIFCTIVCIFFPVNTQSEKNPSRKNLNSLLILCDLPHDPHPKVLSPHVQAGARILKKLVKQVAI